MNNYKKYRWINFLFVNLVALEIDINIWSCLQIMKGGPYSNPEANLCFRVCFSENSPETFLIRGRGLLVERSTHGRVQLGAHDLCGLIFCQKTKRRGRLTMPAQFFFPNSLNESGVNEGL